MRVLTQVARETPFRQRLFDRAIAIGLKRVDGESADADGASAGPDPGPAGAGQGPRPLRRTPGLRRCPAGLGWNPRSAGSTWRSE